MRAKCPLLSKRIASLPDFDFRLMKWILLPPPAEILSAKTVCDKKAITKVNKKKTEKQYHFYF